MIRELTEENDKLKKLMDSLASMGVKLDDAESVAKLAEMRSAMEMNSELMMSKEEKMKNARLSYMP
jgi:hypothetical protein